MDRVAVEAAGAFPQRSPEHLAATATLLRRLKLRHGLRALVDQSPLEPLWRHAQQFAAVVDDILLFGSMFGLTPLAAGVPG